MFACHCLFIFSVVMDHIATKQKISQHNVEFVNLGIIIAPNDQLAILCLVTYKI